VETPLSVERLPPPAIGWCRRVTPKGLQALLQGLCQVVGGVLAKGREARGC